MFIEESELEKMAEQFVIFYYEANVNKESEEEVLKYAFTQGYKTALWDLMTDALEFSDEEQ